MKAAPYLHQPYPLNAPGPFYVVDGWCLACEAPAAEAPDLVDFEKTGPRTAHCYFKRQPKTPEEMQRATRAVVVSCCEALRYNGRDPEVLKQLIERNRVDQCDAVPPRTSGWAIPSTTPDAPVLRTPNHSHPLYDPDLDH